MNSVNLIGRLVKDPELRYISGSDRSDSVYCRFTLAVDKGMSKEKKKELEAKGQQTADFINIVAWNKTAEIVSTYLTKGNLIALAGRIQTRDYDGKDGKRVYVTEVVAEEIFFTGGTNNNYTPKTKIEEEFEIEEEPEIDFEELNYRIEQISENK